MGRLSWVTWVGSTCICIYPFVGGRGRFHPHVEEKVMRRQSRGEDTGHGDGAMWPQAVECLASSSQELEEARNRFSFRAPGGGVAQLMCLF